MKISQIPRATVRRVALGVGVGAGKGVGSEKPEATALSL